MFPPEITRGAVDVMVTIWDLETRDHALALASELRATGLRVDVYPEADKLGKQLKYASSRQLPFVAVVGPDERANGQVSVKDLRSGAQTPVARAEVAAFIAERLHPGPSTSTSTSTRTSTRHPAPCTRHPECLNPSAISPAPTPAALCARTTSAWM
jgi:hypothetical protein